MVAEILGCFTAFPFLQTAKISIIELHAMHFVGSVICIWKLKIYDLIVLSHNDLGFFFSWNYGFANLFVPITGTGEAKTDWLCRSTS